jgi:hypothetical protein
MKTDTSYTFEEKGKTESDRPEELDQKADRQYLIRCFSPPKDSPFRVEARGQKWDPPCKTYLEKGWACRGEVESGQCSLCLLHGYVSCALTFKGMKFKELTGNHCLTRLPIENV